jgi:hypothetical protein
MANWDADGTTPDGDPTARIAGEGGNEDGLGDNPRFFNVPRFPARALSTM